jgi:hypothetical protein
LAFIDSGHAVADRREIIDSRGHHEALDVGARLGGHVTIMGRGERSAGGLEARHREGYRSRIERRYGRCIDPGLRGLRMPVLPLDAGRRYLVPMRVRSSALQPGAAVDAHRRQDGLPIFLDCSNRLRVCYHADADVGHRLEQRR